MTSAVSEVHSRLLKKLLGERGEGAAPGATEILTMSAMEKQQQQIDALEMRLRGHLEPKQAAPSSHLVSAEHAVGTTSTASVNLGRFASATAAPPPPTSPTSSTPRAVPTWRETVTALRHQNDHFSSPATGGGLSNLEARLESAEAALTSRAAAFDDDRDDVQRRLSQAETQLRRLQEELDEAASKASRQESFPGAITAQLEGLGQRVDKMESRFEQKMTELRVAQAGHEAIIAQANSILSNADGGAVANGTSGLVRTESRLSALERRQPSMALDIATKTMAEVTRKIDEQHERSARKDDLEEIRVSLLGQLKGIEQRAETAACRATDVVERKITTLQRRYEKLEGQTTEVLADMKHQCGEALENLRNKYEKNTAGKLKEIEKKSTAAADTLCEQESRLTELSVQLESVLADLRKYKKSGTDKQEEFDKKVRNFADALDQQTSTLGELSSQHADFMTEVRYIRDDVRELKEWRQEWASQWSKNKRTATPPPAKWQQPVSRYQMAERLVSGTDEFLHSTDVSPWASSHLQKEQGGSEKSAGWLSLERGPSASTGGGKLLLSALRSAALAQSPGAEQQTARTVTDTNSY